MSVNWTPRVVWSRRMDMALMDLVAEDHGFVRIGHIMALSKDAVSSRFRRLARDMGPQAQ